MATQDTHRRAEDPVNRPSHYAPEGGVECIDVMTQQFGAEAVADFCKLNAFKYLFRMERKADAREDAEKARWYIDRWLRITGR